MSEPAAMIQTQSFSRGVAISALEKRSKNNCTRHCCNNPGAFGEWAYVTNTVPVTKRFAPMSTPSADAVSVAIVYHSGYGHTAVLADSIAQACVTLGEIPVLLRIDNAAQDFDAILDAVAPAQAVIFGAPTYMGDVSAPFKAFADASSKAFFTGAWKDKLAAGFTNPHSFVGMGQGPCAQQPVDPGRPARHELDQPRRPRAQRHRRRAGTRDPEPRRLVRRPRRPVGHAAPSSARRPATVRPLACWASAPPRPARRWQAGAAIEQPDQAQAA